MQDNRTTDNESVYPDTEGFEIAFEVFEGHPTSAFMLAHHLIAIKEFLQSERRDIGEAVAALDRAVDALYRHSDFRSVSHELYRAAVEGRITTEQEDAIRQLGIRM